MSELDEQIQNRRAKRQALGEGGVDLYPHRFGWDSEPSTVQERWSGATAEELEAAPMALRVPGRVRAIRQHGKSARRPEGCPA
jgi:lysyl-tRNA synthetase class II